MSRETRTPANQTQNYTLEGIHKAVIVDVIDKSFDGVLHVTLLRDKGNTVGKQPYAVKPAFPFFGNTAYEFQGNNIEDFGDTQKSYGMWFVPPDIGTTVLVVFPDLDPRDGYWIACVPPDFAHRMVPAIGADTNTSATAEQKQKYGTTNPLPVGEINRRINGQNQISNEDKIAKPVHPVTDTYFIQGTLEDNVRGPVTSTSRREPPNSVYGISTPGPIDRRPGAPKGRIGPQGNTTGPVPISRLGGTTFVMDDGHDRYVRKGPASEVPISGGYADTQNGESGDPTIPANEFFRIRTRTGHQLLLHNSEDLIYISNARGTSWIEFTSDGKIDVYAKDSVSVHSENDINVYADRDINMEAGRNINLKANAKYSNGSYVDDNANESGRIQMESAFDTNILIGANGKIETRTYSLLDVPIDGNLDINVKGNTKLAVGQGEVEDSYVFDVRTFGTTSIYNTINFNLLSDENNKFTALFGATDILSGGNHTETASVIHMNGPQAAEAPEATVAGTITDLKTHVNIVTDGSKVWASTRYQSGTVNSIMKRIPMHEPWVGHENFTPTTVKPDNTDREK